jgi:mono/diheme cytochrome c family protein
VDDLPDYVEAGKPFTMSYKVRQHGVRLLPSLKGEVEARLGAKVVTARATPGTPGQYAVSLALPQPGNWSLVIRHGFGNASTKGLPIAVVAAGRTVSPLSDAVRGERLFVAKGCVTCHVDIDVGPKLDGRRFEPQYLAQFLANPKPTANLKANQSPMPDLGLKGAEIASLVAFLNGGSEVTVR